MPAHSYSRRVRRQPVDFIAELLAAGVIEYAQLHGSEDAAYIEALRKRTALLGKTAKIIKTVKVGSAAGFGEYLRDRLRVFVVRCVV